MADVRSIEYPGIINYAIGPVIPTAIIFDNAARKIIELTMIFDSASIPESTCVVDRRMIIETTGITAVAACQVGPVSTVTHERKVGIIKVRGVHHGAVVIHGVAI